MLSKPATKKDTWFKELRGPFLKDALPAITRFESAIGLLPKSFQQSWVERIGEQLEASICKTLNIKDDKYFDPTALGVLAAQSSNCFEMNFAPVIKSSGATPEMVKRMKRLCRLINPCQKILGRFHRRVRRVIDRQPYDVQIAFHNGYHRALEKRMYQAHNPIFFETKATRLYCVLLFLAPWMHQVKSVAMLHEILSKFKGALWISVDPKRLQKLCQRIGLTFRKPGCPCKAEQIKQAIPFSSQKSPLRSSSASGQWRAISRA